MLLLQKDQDHTVIWNIEQKVILRSHASEIIIRKNNKQYNFLADDKTHNNQFSIERFISAMCFREISLKHFKGIMHIMKKQCQNFGEFFCCFENHFRNDCTLRQCIYGDITLSEGKVCKWMCNFLCCFVSLEIWLVTEAQS